nr:interferon-induced protein with tetratricopeptide repeats 3-like [Paramormyrops kingsleyae]
MALNQEDSLKIKLIQLQCHFTWGLRKEDTDLSELQNRLENDINFSSADQAGAKHLFSFLAFLKYLQDQPEEALTNLKKAEDHIREHNEECEKMLIVTYGNFAWLFYHLNDHVKSMHYLEKLEDIKQRFPTQSPTAFHAEVYGEMGWTFLMYSRKYNEKAKECFEKALIEHPDNPDWNSGYATALYRVEYESNTTEDSPAGKQLRRALELSPEDPYIMALLGLKLLAIEHYMKGCQIQKDSKVGEKCVQRLEMIAKRRTDRNPSDGEAFGILGYVNQLRGDKLQAIECYEKALLHNPGNDEFLTALRDLRLSLH